MVEKAKETEQMVQSLQQVKADAEERPAFERLFSAWQECLEYILLLHFFVDPDSYDIPGRGSCLHLGTTCSLPLALFRLQMEQHLDC